MVGWLVAPLQNMYLDHSMVQVSGTALHFPSFPLWRSLHFSKHHLVWNSRTGTNSVSWLSDPNACGCCCSYVWIRLEGQAFHQKATPIIWGFSLRKFMTLAVLSRRWQLWSGWIKGFWSGFGGTISHWFQYLGEPTNPIELFSINMRPLKQIQVECILCFECSEKFSDFSFSIPIPPEVVIPVTKSGRLPKFWAIRGHGVGWNS